MSSHWTNTDWNIKVPEIPIAPIEDLIGLLSSTFSDTQGIEIFFHGNGTLNEPSKLKRPTMCLTMGV